MTGGYEHVALTGIANFTVWAAVSFYVLGVKRAPIYHPFTIYLAYHFVGFVLRPFSIAAGEGSHLWERIGFLPDNSDILLTLGLANIGLLSAFIGFLALTPERGAIPKMPKTELTVQRPVLFVAALVALTVLGYYGTYKSFFGAGLESVLAHETAVDAAGGRRLVGVSGYQTALAEFLPIVCLILFLYKPTRTFSYAFIAAFVAVRFFAGAQRLSFVVVIAALFFLYHINKGLRYPAAAPLAALLILGVAFDVIGYDRMAFRSLLAGEHSVEELMSGYAHARGGRVLTSDIAEYDAAAATASAVARNADYSYGTQYLRLFVWPIPRRFWPDKPVYTSRVDLNEYGDFRYLTTSLYADAFMNFGWLSLVLIAGAVGAMSAWVYRAARTGDSAYLFIFFWVFLIYMKTILRDGGVTVVYFWGFSMVAAALAFAAGGVRIWRGQATS
ncbi:MAG: O-antigen polymerase [Pseudomonadota bacterium]